MAKPNKTRIELEIDELVLHGFEAGDRFAICEAIERGIERALLDQGMAKTIASRGDVQRARVDAGNVVLAEGWKTNRKADSLGGAIARSLVDLNPRSGSGSTR